MNPISGSTVPRRAFLKTVSAIPLLGWSTKSAGASGVYVEEGDSTVRIGNGLIELSFGKESGSIDQVRAVEQGIELQNSDGAGPAITWELSFYHSETEYVTAPSYEAEVTSITTTSDGDEATVLLDWATPRLYPSVEEGPRFDGAVSVEVTVEEGDPLSYWYMDVTNDDELAIRSITCPKIMDIEALRVDGDDAIVLPDRMGRRFVDPTRWFDELDESAGMLYPSGYGTMQFTAYTGPDGGFYSDARDTDGYVKRWNWERSWEDPDRLSVGTEHFAPRTPGEDFTVPYAVTFGVLDGDWPRAAERYRSWVESEGWLDVGDVERSSWLRDLGATYRIETYHPEGEAVEFARAAERVREMQSFLDVPMQFQFGQWHDGPDDVPVEGWEEFERTVEEVASAGIRTNSFVGGNLIHRDATVVEENEEAEEWIVRGEDDAITWFGDSEQFYLIESTQDGWQEYIRSYIQGLTDRGVSEIQFDGFPWVLPACFASNHDHPPGQAGNWYATAARRDARELQDQLRSADEGVLSGEGICEFYVPYLDAFNTRDVFAEYLGDRIETGWFEVIPLFEYVFGDRVVTRNQNHEGLVLEPSITRLFTARSLLWGALPVFRHGDPATDPEVPGYDDPSDSLVHFRRVARARANYANRFLARGRMLPPPDIESAEVVLAGHGGVEVDSDAVLGSAWQSTTGETGLVMTNVSSGDSPKPFEVELAYDQQPFSVPEGDTFSYLVRNGAYEQLEDARSEAVTVTIDPDDVVLLVVASSEDEYVSALDAIVDAQASAAGAGGEEVVSRAKRSFERGDFQDVHTELDRLTELDRTTDPPAQPTPGFGVGVTIGGVAGTAVLMKWLLEKEE